MSRVGSGFLEGGDGVGLEAPIFLPPPRLEMRELAHGWAAAAKDSGRGTGRQMSAWENATKERVRVRIAVQ